LGTSGRKGQRGIVKCEGEGLKSVKKELAKGSGEFWTWDKDKGEWKET